MLGPFKTQQNTLISTVILCLVLLPLGCARPPQSGQLPTEEFLELESTTDEELEETDEELKKGSELLSEESLDQALRGLTTDRKIASIRVPASPKEQVKTLNEKIHENTTILKEGRARLTVTRTELQNWKGKFSKIKHKHTRFKAQTKDLLARVQTITRTVGKLSKKIKDTEGKAKKKMAVRIDRLKKKHHTLSTMLKELKPEKLRLIVEIKQIKSAVKEIVTKARRERDYLISVQQQTVNLKHRLEKTEQRLPGQSS